MYCLRFFTSPAHLQDQREDRSRCDYYRSRHHTYQDAHPRDSQTWPSRLLKWPMPEYVQFCGTGDSTTQPNSSPIPIQFALAAICRRVLTILRAICQHKTANVMWLLQYVQEPTLCLLCYTVSTVVQLGRTNVGWFLIPTGSYFPVIRFRGLSQTVGCNRNWQSNLYPTDNLYFQIRFVLGIAEYLMSEFLWNLLVEIYKIVILHIVVFKRLKG